MYKNISRQYMFICLRYLWKLADHLISIIFSSVQSSTSFYSAITGFGLFMAMAMSMPTVKKISKLVKYCVCIFSELLVTLNLVGFSGGGIFVCLCRQPGLA